MFRVNRVFVQMYSVFDKIIIEEITKQKGARTFYIYQLIHLLFWWSNYIGY